MSYLFPCFSLFKSKFNFNNITKRTDSGSSNIKNKTIDYEEPVVITSTIFPSDVNRGYDSASCVLIEVNDIKIKNFKHLVDVLDSITDEFTVFEFLEKRKVVLNTKWNVPYKLDNY